MPQEHHSHTHPGFITPHPAPHLIPPHTPFSLPHAQHAHTHTLTPHDRTHLWPPSCPRSLDYPGIGPEHSYLKDARRVEYHAIGDDDALAAFQRLSQLEGIIPALESSHAVAYLDQLCPTLPAGTNIVLNCSGRGDKDVDQVIRMLNM